MESTPPRIARRPASAPWQCVGFVDDGVEFFLRELRCIDVVGGRKNAATGARFDNVGAVFVIEADGLTRLIGAIDHAFFRPGFRKQAFTETRGVVAMSTC